MDAAVIGGTALIGLASTPHCAVMCGAPCAAICGRDASSVASFQFARMAGYAAAGAVATTGLASLGEWARQLHGLMAVWTVFHAGLLVLGLHMLATGRLPAFAGLGSRAPLATGAGVQAIRWAPARAGLAGVAWVGWPCGALQGAIVIAALASGPAGGALAMGAFALSSSAGLWLAPWLLRRLTGARVSAARLAGALLALASGWALAHGLWQQISVWCA
ncbi:MAG: sulfite exporter TauE/SafE family protein [Paucibacter sp.]|nr:sulfite exporter TauE/SafE family protein [Roseateles sp.]